MAVEDGLEFEESIEKLENKIADLKQLSGSLHVDLSAEIAALERKLNSEKKIVYSSISPWQKVLMQRETRRPHLW